MNTLNAALHAPARPAPSLPLRRWLMLPWQALEPSARWLVAIVLGMVVCGAVLARALTDTKGIVLAGVILALGVGFAWAYLLAHCIAWVHTARLLQLPHARREVNVSLLVYVMVSIVLPALVLTLAGGSLHMALLGLLLTASAGLFLALLPGYGFILMVMAYFALLAGNQWLPVSTWSLLPSPKDADFTRYLVLVDAGLVSLAVARWMQVSNRATSHARLQRPMIFNLSPALNGQRRSSSLMPDERLALRQRADWMQPTVVLRHTGPGHVMRSLRVALGAHWLPISGISRMCQYLLVLAFIGGLVLFFGLLSGDGDDAFLWSLLTHGSGWMVLVGGLVASLATTAMLKLRWSQHNAEMPLMALLPGLGSVNPVKRALLKLTLGHVVLTWLQLSALAWLLLSWSNGRISVPLTALIAAIGLYGLLFNLSQTLSVLGHRRLPWSDKLMLIVYLPLLGLASGAYALAVLLGGVALSAGLLWLLIFGWALLLLPLGRAIMQGWHGFQGQPHAFLVRD